MSTKVSKIWEGSPTAQKELIPISFIELLSVDGTVSPTNFKPSDFSEVMLINSMGSREDYDIMIAKDGDCKHWGVYLGHWNDGVVETPKRAD